MTGLAIQTRRNLLGMRILGVRLATTIAALCICTAQAQYGGIKLASGTTVKVLSVGPLNFSGGAPPSLMMRYQSDIDFADIKALHKEAQAIWKLFRPEVEQGHYLAAILSANAPPSAGPISRSQGYNFTFEKQGNIWRETDDAAKS